MLLQSWESPKSINDLMEIYVNCENTIMNSIMSNCLRILRRICKPQACNYQITAVVLTLDVKSGPSNLVNTVIMQP